MLPSFCNDTVTVMRAPLVESRGSSVRDWSNAKGHEIGGCSVQVSSATGDIQGREHASVSCLLLAPPGSDIAIGDRIIFDGKTWNVVGEPYAQRSATGRISHLVATMERRDG